MKVPWLAVLIIITGFTLFAFLNRHKIVPTKDGAYLINSFTGDSWFLLEHLKIPIEELPSKRETKKLEAK